jgi:hypothetical protein
VRAVLDGSAAPDAEVGDLIGERTAEAVLATRQSAADTLRAGVLAAVAAAAPPARISLHARADPWATGPDVACGQSTVDGVDAVLVPSWPTVPATVAALARMRAIVPGRVSVGAYVTVLPPADPSAVVAHAAALREAGAAELHLYHLGLAPPAGQRLLADIVRSCRPAT